MNVKKGIVIFVLLVLAIFVIALISHAAPTPDKIKRSAQGYYWMIISTDSVDLERLDRGLRAAPAIYYTDREPKYINGQYKFVPWEVENNFLWIAPAEVTIQRCTIWKVGE